MNDTSTIELNAHDEIDQELLRQAILDGAANPAGVYVCDLAYSVEAEAAFLEAALARTLDNNKRSKNKEAHLAASKIAGGTTADTVGMLGEGPMRLALPNEAWSAIFVEGDTDKRPDVVIDNVRFDVKAASRNGRSTFSVEAPKWDSGVFDALILVKPLKPGLARIYVCAARPNVWTRHKGIWTPKGRLPDFYLLVMPDPAPTKARQFKKETA